MNKSEQKVLVDKDVLTLIVDALKRDAADGYVIRGLMLKMLERSIGAVEPEEEFTTSVRYGPSGWGPAKVIVRVTHNPSGLFAESKDACSKHRNAEVAKSNLVNLLKLQGIIK